MATVFDGDNLIATLNAGGAVHTVDAGENLYSEWKEWVKTTGHQYEPMFRVVGGDPLTPGINAGSYFFLRNDLGWRIRPAEENATIFMTGNLVPEQSSLPLAVPTIGAFTVLLTGLQPITQNVAELLTQAQNAEYRGQIAIDTVNGVSGTAYPVGIATNPVNNWADALTLAATLNITTFTLKGTITLTSASESYEFIGLSSSNIINLNSFSVDKSKMTNITISGAGTGEVVADNCTLDALSGISGQFRRCALPNNVTLGAGTSIFERTYSSVAGNGKPWVSLNGLNSQVSFRGHIGGLDLRGVSNASASVTVDIVGRLLLASSNTAGEIVCGSPGGELLDSSAGSTIKIESFLEVDDVRRTRKRLVNREYTNPTTNKLEQYTDDGGSIEYSANIYEDDGTTPWDGTGPIRRRDKMT